MIEFSRDICGNLASSESREWLVTNGIGGFASGTISGVLTRSYHGLLIATLHPPSDRTYLVSKLNETVTYASNQYPINSDRWTGGVINPIGYLHIENFKMEGSVPVWTYALGDALLEKRVWMKQGANTTFVQYKMVRGNEPLTLTAVPMVNYRRIHDTTHADGWEMQIEAVPNGLKITAYTGAVPYYVLCDQAEIDPDHTWHRRFFMMREANRGHNPTEDHLKIGQFQVTLQSGESTLFTLSTEMMFNVDGEKALSARHTYDQQLLDKASNQIELSSCSEDIKQLILAAGQFVVRRPLPNDPDGYAIMSGYHWLNTNTRDTIRALPGLLLTTGRADIAGKLLRKFAFRINQGLLPDRLDTNPNDSQYKSLDSTLWYIQAIRAYYERTQNASFVRELYPALQDIFLWLVRGTHHDIQADPEDGMLHTGNSNTPLTWMNAKIDDWTVTPRIGKPVEINALWYNALHTLAEFAKLSGENPSRYIEMADKVKKGFGRFWNKETGTCYDVIDGPDGHDGCIRPNAIFAVSLPNSPLTPEQQKSVVDVCAGRLLTSHGLRTLAPEESTYIGQFGGDAKQRGMAVHQGTVFAGLIGPFIRAHLRVYQEKNQAKSFIHPLCRQINAHGIGTVGELFDGEPPFAPHGCLAFAWSVAELLHTHEVISAETA